MRRATTSVASSDRGWLSANARARRRMNASSTLLLSWTEIMPVAKLIEKGLLRPSFVPSAEIRQLRDYTRLRVDLTRERTRHWQRLEKLLEDALIKVSSVASKMDTLSVRDMLEALIGGER